MLISRTPGLAILCPGITDLNARRVLKVLTGQYPISDLKAWFVLALADSLTFGK
jgi:hypothetical protein